MAPGHNKGRYMGLWLVLNAFGGYWFYGRVLMQGGGFFFFWGGGFKDR